MDGSITDEQSLSLLSHINLIAVSISQMLNLRFNLKCKFNNQDYGCLNLKDIQLNESINSINTVIGVNKSLLSVPSPSADLKSNNNFRWNDKRDDISSTNMQQDAAEEEDSGCNFRRRLPKDTLNVLNEWYKENLDNPYLTKDDIVVLKSRTMLKESQIKNWASNKRRKRKESQISEELTQLLGRI